MPKPPLSMIAINPVLADRAGDFEDWLRTVLRNQKIRAPTGPRGPERGKRGERAGSHFGQHHEQVVAREEAPQPVQLIMNSVLKKIFISGTGGALRAASSACHPALGGTGAIT